MMKKNMVDQFAPERAPCVAMIGSPNSGKTTLLHLLDASLQTHPAKPFAYVVKGNPDGSGRYLYRSPDLREAVKPLVKGQWIETTPRKIVEWVENARGRLEIVLLDFGGRHTELNHGMLTACTHYIVLSRLFPDDSAREEAGGMQSWINAAKAARLQPVAHVRSLWQEGEPYFDPASLDCGFRADAAVPGDHLNYALVQFLTARLMELRRRRPERTPYFDLHLGRIWQEKDLPTLDGRLNRLAAQVDSQGWLTLGGIAPLWAYAAAMHHALNRESEIPIKVFDPKLPGAFVRIPAKLRPELPGFPLDALHISWATDSKGHAVLKVSLGSVDRILGLDAVQNLANLPVPAGPALDDAAVLVDGPGPVWLHLTLSRWLRGDGVRQIAHWDAAWKRPVVVWQRTP